MIFQHPLGTRHHSARVDLRVSATGALLAALTAASGPASALAVFNSARADFINGSSAGYEMTANIDSPGFSTERLQGPHGFAEGTVSVGTATIGLDTVVKLTSPGVTLSSRAVGSFIETFNLGDSYCTVSTGCQSLEALGISFIEFSFGIHAAGSVNVSRLTNFDNGTAGLLFNWELITSLGDIAFGGGSASARRESNIEEFFDDVSDGTAVVRLRPGDGLELRLRAEGFSGAGAGESQVESRVTFSNTLRWDGVHAFTAFDKDVRPLDLAPGRFALRGVDTGFDYWNAAGRATSGVPEPGTWALLLGPLGWLAQRRCRLQRDRHSARTLERYAAGAGDPHARRGAPL